MSGEYARVHEEDDGAASERSLWGLYDSLWPRQGAHVGAGHFVAGGDELEKGFGDESQAFEPGDGRGDLLS